MWHAEKAKITLAMVSEQSVVICSITARQKLNRVIFSVIYLTYKGRHMYVYVINKHDEPLMPCKPQKARVLTERRTAISPADKSAGFLVD